MSLRGDKRTEFPQKVRKQAFARCCREGTKPGIPQCEGCGNELRAGGIIYEHDQADGLGGEPVIENCKVHCPVCATKKTVEEDNPRMAKADAVLKATYGLQPTRRKKIQSHGFAKPRPQLTASRPIKRKSDA